MPDKNGYTTPSEWFMTDDDCLQHCRCHPAIDPQVYELVQINSFPGHLDGKPFYQVAHAHIDIKDYTDEEILDALGAYGYEGMDDFVFQNTATNEFLYREDGTLDRDNSPGYIIDYQLIAEMLFELEALEIGNDGHTFSWNEAVDKVGEITGQDLQIYHEREEGLPDLVDDTLLFGEREDDLRRCAFLTTPRELAKTFGFTPEHLMEDLRKTRSNFGDGMCAIYGKDGIHYFVRSTNLISRDAALAAATIADALHNGKYSVVETPSAETCKVLPRLLQPIFDAGFYDVHRDHNVMDALAYAKEQPAYLDALRDIFICFHLMNVERDRRSVTQGEAVVNCAGKQVVRYGDEMYLQTRCGDFSSGFRTVTHAQHHGPVIGGWGSIKPDEHFIRVSLTQYPARIRQNLENPQSLEQSFPLDALIHAARTKTGRPKKKDQQAVLESIEPSR